MLLYVTSYLLFCFFLLLSQVPSLSRSSKSDFRGVPKSKTKEKNEAIITRVRQILKSMAVDGGRRVLMYMHRKKIFIRSATKYNLLHSTYHSSLIVPVMLSLERVGTGAESVHLFCVESA
jgi:hypothetical protein